MLKSDRISAKKTAAEIQEGGNFACANFNLLILEQSVTEYLLFGKYIVLGWFSVTLKMSSISLTDESSPSRVPPSSTSGRMSLTSGRIRAVHSCSDERAVEVRFIDDHSHFRFRSPSANRKWGWMTSSSK